MRLRPSWLTLFLLFSGLPGLKASDSIPNIRITLSERNRSIQHSLEEITLQTGFLFTYDASLIRGDEKRRFGALDLPLQSCLDSLLNNPELSYRLIDRNIVIYRKNLEAPAAAADSIDRSLITGRVVDRRNGKPLSYATLALYGSHLGAISNQEGSFAFKIPIEEENPLLVISYMGYKNKMLALTYPQEGPVEIEMERQVLPLQEVIIRQTDPVRLLQEALLRIPDNYGNEHATMTAFYREAVKRNEHCMLYSEALVDIAKSPYGSGIFRDQVQIQRGRKITDVNSEDTIMIKLRSGLQASLSLDIVKQRADFLQPDFADRYILEFSDIVSYGDRLVYVINFHQRPHITSILFGGKIYIDQLSMAIVAADFQFSPELIHKEPDLFLISSSPRIRIRPVQASYHVDYHLNDGLYYLGQVRADVVLKVRRRRRWIGSRYRISLEMAITDNRPGERLRIPHDKRVRENLIMVDQTFPFDPLFWGIHNTIQPEATLMESIRRLELQLQEKEAE